MKPPTSIPDFRSTLPFVSKNPATPRARAREDQTPVRRSFQHRVLVTGSNRSGTTFLGSILAAAPGTIYAYEPFSPKHGLEGISEWYLYLERGLAAEQAVKPRLDAFMRGRGVFRRRPTGAGVSVPHRLFRLCFRSINQFHYTRGALLHPHGTLLIKDPIALLSADYLTREYDCQTVILLRHPCAYYLSLQRMQWTMYPALFLAQREFAARYLPEFLGIPNTALNRDPLTMASFVWLFLYTAAARFADRNGAIVLLRHEDLSLDPFREVEALCGKIGLPYTAEVRRKVKQLTSSHNPVEATEAQTHSLRRDSARNAYLWRDRLSQTEISRIMGICGGLASRWYE